MSRQHHENYHGPDQLHVGNGKGLPISHISSTLSRTHSSFISSLMFSMFPPLRNITFSLSVQSR